MIWYPLRRLFDRLIWGDWYTYTHRCADHGLSGSDIRSRPVCHLCGHSGRDHWTGRQGHWEAPEGP